MPLQDYFPYDSAILGLNGLFYTRGLNSFFVNSKCILTKGKIITNGISYLIASTSNKESEKIVHKVTLMDVLFYKGVVYLFVLELESNKHYILDVPIECPDKTCDWILYDWDELNKKAHYKTIENYCSKSSDCKNKSVEKIKDKNTNNDLLNFDY
jgi:hypothetical protein